MLAETTIVPRTPCIEIATLRSALRQSWTQRTSHDRDLWTPENPATGQCAVTALVVQDFLGGSIVWGELSSGSHYWNRLPGGDELDLTAEQFSRKVAPSRVEERSRSELLSSAATRHRYAWLRQAVDQAIATGCTM